MSTNDSSGSRDSSLEGIDNDPRKPSTLRGIIAIGAPPIKAETEVNVGHEKRRIYKNVFLISTAFLFNFTAFQGLSRLQSSLNRVEGMGVITSSVIYATLMLSCMFVPKPIINLIGHKWTMTISFSGYILYMAANGYAVWGTLTTASILVGLCAAPLWTAQCSYFTIIGQRYARLNKESETNAVSRFFGIFFMFFQASSITGSIISATVLRGNVTTLDDVDLSGCGAANCPWTNRTNDNLDKPPSQTVWTMVGIYLAIAFLAVAIVALFVDNLPKDAVPQQNVTKEIAQNFVATFLHLRHPKQLLIIPLTMYSGFEQASFNAEFSQAFVGCSLGIWQIGLVTLPYGFANACMSIGSGHVIKYTGRLPIFIFGMCVDLCTQITLMTWQPTPQQDYVLYILATMWGLTDGIWQTQINTLYGSLFGGESEAAFSNYRMWESFGFIIAFAYSFYLCTSVKLYILTSVLVVGICGYLAVEYVHWHEAQNKHNTNSAVEHDDQMNGDGVKNSSFSMSEASTTKEASLAAETANSSSDHQ